MRSIFKTGAAALAVTTMLAGTALAQELSGTLRISSDMSDPAPRAVMESLAAEFDALHPNLTVELTVVDREAWKTQIRNALSCRSAGCGELVCGQPHGPLCQRRSFHGHHRMVGCGRFRRSRVGARCAHSRTAASGVCPIPTTSGACTTARTSLPSLACPSPRPGNRKLPTARSSSTRAGIAMPSGSRFLWPAGGWFDYLNMRTKRVRFPHGKTCPWRDRLDR